jgi:hypothetical protein
LNCISFLFYQSSLIIIGWAILRVIKRTDGQADE